MTFIVDIKSPFFFVLFKGTILTYARLTMFGGGCKSGANNVLIHPVLSAKVTLNLETS